jgi:hypothetical protein
MVTRHCDAENFILDVKCEWQVGSRWYTSDLPTVTIDSLLFARLWHPDLYSGKRNCQLSVASKPADSSVCYKLLASQVLLKGSKEMEITRLHTANHTNGYGLQAEGCGPPFLQSQSNAQWCPSSHLPGTLRAGWRALGVGHLSLKRFHGGGLGGGGLLHWGPWKIC